MITYQQRRSQTIQVVMLIASALTVGISLLTFSGSIYAWIALVSLIIVMISIGYKLISSFWRS